MFSGRHGNSDRLQLLGATDDDDDDDHHCHPTSELPFRSPLDLRIYLMGMIFILKREYQQFP